MEHDDWLSTRIDIERKIDGERERERLFDPGTC